MSRALVLFSGGLDSILAARTLMAQGVEVLGLRMVTPFFGVGDEAAYIAETRAKYGIELRCLDVAEDFMAVLRAPAHGFGHNFNPCIDCKIFMLSKARELMPRFGADFLATGEVLGQRPMSQRRDAMRVIERDSGCEGILLRPLCAQLMRPIRAEIEGLVDREQLLRLSGRGRVEQQKLAASYGITKYPAPAGGCLLTDVNLTGRFRRFASGIFATLAPAAQVRAFQSLLVGRHFAPAPGFWLALGRDKTDNERLLALKEKADWVLTMVDRPGPVGIVKKLTPGAPTPAELSMALPPVATHAAGLLLRYAKKVEGKAAPGIVRLQGPEWGGAGREERFSPLTDEQAEGMLV